MDSDKNSANQNYAGYKIIYKKPQEQLSGDQDPDVPSKKQKDDSEDYIPGEDDSGHVKPGRKPQTQNKRKKRASKADDDDGSAEKKKRKGRPVGSKNKSKVLE